VPRHRHELPGGQAATDRVAELDDLRDALVAERKRPGEWRLAPQDHLVEIACRRGDRPEEGVVAALNGRIRNLPPFQMTG
jgi:hypothetical protein